MPYHLWSTSITIDELTLVTQKLESNNIDINLWFDTDMEIGTSDGAYLGYYVNYHIEGNDDSDLYRLFEVLIEDY